MTRDEAKVHLREFGELPIDLREPCAHGHAGCSVSVGGPCHHTLLRQVFRTHEFMDDDGEHLPQPRCGGANLEKRPPEGEAHSDAWRGAVPKM